MEMNTFRSRPSYIREKGPGYTENRIGDLYRGSVDFGVDTVVPKSSGVAGFFFYFCDQSQQW
jgi:hypothetical protein